MDTHCSTFIYQYQSYWERIDLLITSGFLRSCTNYHPRFSRSISVLVPILKIYVQFTSIRSKISPDITNEVGIQQPQDSLTSAFDKKLLEKIEHKMWREVRLQNIDYNLVQWIKLLQSRSYGLCQDDYKQEVHVLRTDPAHIILYLSRCIQNIENRRHEFSKSAQDEMYFNENMNYNYASSHTQRHPIRPHPNQIIYNHEIEKSHHEMHNLLTHLAFQTNLIFTICTRCATNALGRVDVYDNKFYCFSCLPPYYKSTPLLKTAHEEAPQNQCKGRRKTIQSIKESFARDFRYRSLFKKYGAILALKDEHKLSQTELFALLVKYGFGTFLLHTFHCLNQLKAQQILVIDGWIDKKCQDNAFNFQQISIDWFHDFKVFCRNDLKLTSDEITQWLHKPDERNKEIPWQKYFNHDRPNVIGFLSFIINVLKHYNTMFGKQCHENEYGIWLKILHYFKGSMRLVTKMEASLQAYVKCNRSYLQRVAPLCVELMDNLKEDLCEIYHFTKGCAVDYVGFALFKYGLVQLNKRQHPGYYRDLLNNRQIRNYPTNINVDCVFFGRGHEEEMNRLKTMDQHLLDIDDWTNDHDMLLNMSCDRKYERMCTAAGYLSYDSDYGDDNMDDETLLKRAYSFVDLVSAYFGSIDKHQREIPVEIVQITLFFVYKKAYWIRDIPFDLQRIMEHLRMKKH